MMLSSEKTHCWRNCVILSALLLSIAGCTSKVATIAPSASATGRNHHVIAQGQILPAQGFIQLAASPGDVVDEVHVAVGNQVSRLDRLVTMRSEAVRKKQLEALRTRRTEAEREKAQAESQAERGVAAAKLKLQHISSQLEALKRQDQLLKLAREQVDASKTVLQKLESIAHDAVTSEFVGQLEIDRQNVAVGKSELNFRQQQETQRRAAEDLEWAERVAKTELTAANEMLSATRESGAIAVIDLEIETLETQTQSALILAPADGSIVAVNVSAGEASIQLPLIEMANLNQMVCEVEINEMDAGRVGVGDKAVIHSRAFGDSTLSGTVLKKYAMVGRPQFKPLDPLARVDYRSVTAIVELDADATKRAKDWLQLQVEVEIHSGSLDSSNAQSVSSP